jgi:hypothetical protein
MAWDCSAYYSYIADRTPHWTEELLQDWFPTDDAWIGAVMSEPWGAFTGTQHVRDRLHMAAPDLSQGWNQFDTQSMLTNNGLGTATGEASACTSACTPPEICVAWGLTRSTFDRWRTSYTTRPFCFDEINTRALAKKQLGEIISGLKDISRMVQSDRHRYASAVFIDKIYLAGNALDTVDVTGATFTGAATTMDLGGALPTSELTIQYLQRFYEPLQAEGYFRYKYVPNGMFKLITDPITSQQLTTGNPALIANYRFTDFQEGGKLFKYGMSSAIGNFGITWDMWPMRFYYDSFAGVFRRVFPYVNVAAGATGGPTMGIKKTVNQQYILAPYQLSQIWHPAAMKRYTVDLASVNPEMPFLTRDLLGKWNFIGGNKDRFFKVIDPISGDECLIDNKRGNQGAFWADFEDGMEMQRPELVRQILHLREPGCVVDQVPCSVAPAYITQDYSGCLPLCQSLT